LHLAHDLRCLLLNVRHSFIKQEIGTFDLALEVLAIFLEHALQLGSLRLKRLEIVVCLADKEACDVRRTVTVAVYL